MLKLIIALFATLSITAALQVTAPTNSSGWQTKGSQLISWNAVSTDPQNFTIQLYTPTAPNTPQTIAQVNSSAGSYIYTPTSDLAAGQQYRVNLFGSQGGTASQGGILAQSDYFAVVEGTSTVSATASISASSTSGSPSQTSGNAASSASSAAASATSSRSAAGSLVAPGGVLIFIAGAIGAFA